MDDGGRWRVFHVKPPGHDAIARHAGEHLVTAGVELPRPLIRSTAAPGQKRLLTALAVLCATVLISGLDLIG
jgi:voltage-gated potassium channel